MVHLRLNERESIPNKHINFISPLPAPEIPVPYSEEDARQLLRALAAQIRPVMKSHGFAVNSFEEYEYNRVFAGRNWNNGETIELVLRRADGTFAPVPWLLGTLCHELAHIKHMNHGRDFQRLWAQLRMEVEALQVRGYFGDGYWSSGTRVSDSVRIGGQGVEDFDLPEYVCGGAQSRSRPKSIGQRRRRVQRRAKAGPSNHTGAQVEKRRKPGTRVKAKGAFKGEGKALNDDISDEDVKARGIGFRKQAGNKRAREERALAAERRLRALKGEAIKDEEPKATLDEESVTESDSDYDESGEKETDETRRKTMRDSIRDSDESFNSSQQFMRDFLLKAKEQRGEGKSKGEMDDGNFKSVFDAIEISDEEVEAEEGDGACAIPSTSNPVIPSPSSSTNDTRSAKRPRQQSPPRSTKGTRPALSRTPGNIGLGRIAEEEMIFRKKEALGLTGGGKKLGSSRGSRIGNGGQSQGKEHQKRDEERREKSPVTVKDSSDDGPGWSCLVCTLDNLPDHLACSACGTPRGEIQWPQQ
ncbi:hypothetical protein ACEPAF_8612 [Sanghuangporus sanghuang]